MVSWRMTSPVVAWMHADVEVVDEHDDGGAVEVAADCASAKSGEPRPSPGPRPRGPNNSPSPASILAASTGCARRSDRRLAGWTWANLDDLAHAARLPTRDRSLPELAASRPSPWPEWTCVRSAVAPAFPAVRLSPSHRTAVTLPWASASPTAFSLAVLLIDPDSCDEARLPLPPSWRFQLSKKVQDGVRSLVFSPDGRWLVAGTRSGQMHRWNLTEKSPRAVSWQGHPALVSHLAFHPDGTALYSRGQDGTFRRWNVAACWKETARFKTHCASGNFALDPAGAVPHLPWRAEALLPRSEKSEAAPCRRRVRGHQSVCQS